MSNIEDYYFLLMPIIVFLLRIGDVSIATIKLLFIVRGYKLIAGIMAFLEVCIWLVATSIVFQHLDNIWNTIAFATGFASGTVLGMTIEQKLGIGHVMVRIFTRYPVEKLSVLLREQNFGATSVQGVGKDGALSVVLVLTSAKKANELTRLIKERDADSVITIDAVRSVFGGFGTEQPRLASVRK